MPKIRSLKQSCHHLLRTIPVILFFAACTAPGEYVYLNDLGNPADTLLGPIRPYKERLIMPDDQISIQVTAYNPDDVQMFGALLAAGQGGTGLSLSPSSSTGGQSPSTMGYLVDKKGMVTLPYVGEFMAAGLTIREMEIFLGKQLERFVKQPVVKVRYLNHYVNVIGDVRMPNQIAMVNERMTIFDVLAKTGDLNPTAIRNNLLVVREDNGYRVTGRIDLLSKRVFESPFYYVQNRDIIYIEPVQASYVSRTDKVTRYLGTLGTIVSIFLSALALSK